MRMSDWCSDVCSSDRIAPAPEREGGRVHAAPYQPAQALDREVTVGGAALPHRELLAFAGERPDAVVPRALIVDRKSVVSGKSVSVRVDPGGRRNIQKKNKK